MANNKENQPVRVFRIGSVSASVFEVESTDSGPYHRVRFTRSFRLGDEWKTSMAFGLADVPLLIVVAQLALAYVHANQANSRP